MDEAIEANEASDLLDELRGRLRGLTALLAAADERADAVPHTTDPEQRERLGHLVELVALARAACDEALRATDRPGPSSRARAARGEQPAVASRATPIRRERAPATSRGNAARRERSAARPPRRRR